MTLHSCSVHFQDIVSHVNSIFYLNELCGDGCAKCVYNCKSKRCLMENIFAAENRVASTYSKQFFYCVTPCGAVYLDRCSHNIIHLINCSRCWEDWPEDKLKI